ncbi:33 kDa inner dynein arm light chain, axonemal-like [Cimex lectularius]|uniref:33 kDa inner dynein arm light chain, axonemal n=1 Tax=Cimex lectularius TaxID=79782 RepID=A0A8I6TFN0_CIMLE|nr:33 kDa inner dynein arm light chain, axonemal-like [Cimex lectularius]
MGSKILAAEPTLVKYSNPVLVVNKEGKADKSALDIKTESIVYAKDITSDRSVSTQQVLDCILPPRQWEEDGQLWKQQVSPEPATRADVLKLGEQLDTKLQQKRARETGICGIRRNLFTQAFDEIIRQVTINCAERGLLLLRVRDEMRMTANAYQSLYESSIAYGMRKALMAEQNRSNLEEELKRLRDEKSELKKRLLELRARYELMDRRAAELRATEEKKHNEELAQLRRTNNTLKAQLETIIAPKKHIDIHK